MTTLKITGLAPNPQVVSLISAVGKYSTGSLAKGKALVEELIGGKEIVLSFENDARMVEFRELATSLGAHVA